MNITPGQEAIANLIDLAERGEIDPWDVPVITIIDRFLAELGLIDGTQELPQQEADLPRSGQAFLWASMLVLLKADTLELLQEDILEIEESEFYEAEILAEVNRRRLPANLEQHLRRRTSLQPVGKRRVTLQELIEQLEHIAAEIEAVSSDTSPRRSGRSRNAAIKAIAQLAHNENLTELAAQLESFLHLNISQLPLEQDYLDWELLLQKWHTSEAPEISATSHPDSDRAGIFWALLLLSAQSKVELFQAEFYQDLSIRPLHLPN